MRKLHSFSGTASLTSNKTIGHVPIMIKKIPSGQRTGVPQSSTTVLLGVGLPLALCLALLNTPVSNNTIGGECYVPLTPDQAAGVVANVSDVAGYEAGASLAAAIADGSVTLVNTPNISGTADSDTIGVDMEQSPGVVGTVVAHEREHQMNAAGAGTDGDPTTDWGPPGEDGKPTNPCGGKVHAQMGVDSLMMLGGYVCGEAISDGEKKLLCGGWWGMKNKIYGLLSETKAAGCDIGMSAGEFVGTVDEKPPCCD